MENIFGLQKKSIFLCLAFEEISNQPKLFIPTRFRTQGGYPERYWQKNSKVRTEINIWLYPHLGFYLQWLWFTAYQPVSHGVYNTMAPVYKDKYTIWIIAVCYAHTKNIAPQMSMYWYFDVLTITPARTLLERLRKKNWNLKTPFTHGLRHFWSKTPKSKFKSIKKGFNNMFSDLSKSVFKMASEDLQKILLKSTKNMKSSGFFSDLRGLNYQSYHLFEATLL